MSSSMLYRLSGLALLLGSLLTAIWFVFAPVFFFRGGISVVTGPAYLPVILSIALGLMLLMVGLLGMYTRQAVQVGWLGLVGFVLTLFGLLLAVSIIMIFATIFPWLATVAPKLLIQGPGPITLLNLIYGTFLPLSLGTIFLGIATMRAGVLSNGAGALLFFSGAAHFVVFLALFSSWGAALWFAIISQVLLASGLAWIGYPLVFQQKAEAVQPSPVVKAVPGTEANG
ncbi:MAG TPA: hypothetical protein VIY29_22400 [Ktedonobacteraceae bacterium]